MPEVAVFAPGTPMWVDVVSPDLESSKRFYSGLFSWEAHTMPQPEAGGYTMFLLHGKQVAALSSMQDPAGHPAWSVYMATEDAAATANAVREAGGKVIAEPFDVLDAGRMAAFQDPTGAFFSVWQPGTMKGADVVNEAGSFAWSELHTRDIEGAKRFYQKVFNWGVKDTPMGENAPPYTEWQLNGKSIGGGMPMGDQMAGIPPNWLVYFGASDVDGTAKKAAELGGKVMMPPMDFPGGRFAVVTDPHSAAFGILKMS